MSALVGEAIGKRLGPVLIDTNAGKKNRFGVWHLYVEWQVESGCQKMQWIFAVLFIS